MKTFTLAVCLVLLSLGIFITFYKIEPEVQYVPYIVEVERQEFSEQALIDYLNLLRIPHSHIVLAQAKLETGNFTSSIFIENNNLFGMKRAYGRPSTAIGTNRQHAKYKHWKDSVVDFALYSAYVAQGKSIEEYLTLLETSYAEDPEYVKKVNRIALTTREHFYF